MDDHDRPHAPPPHNEPRRDRGSQTTIPDEVREANEFLAQAIYTSCTSLRSWTFDTLVYDVFVSSVLHFMHTCNHVLLFRGVHCDRDYGVSLAFSSFHSGVIIEYEFHSVETFVRYRATFDGSRSEWRTIADLAIRFPIPEDDSSLGSGSRNVL